MFDPDTITDKELEEMNELGVRGLRVDTQADGGHVNIEALKKSLANTA